MIFCAKHSIVGCRVALDDKDLRKIGKVVGLPHEHILAALHFMPAYHFPPVLQELYAWRGVGRKIERGTHEEQQRWGWELSNILEM